MLDTKRRTLNIEHLIGLPAEGLEPTRPCGHWILSPARLPIPPRRLFSRKERHDTIFAQKLNSAKHANAAKHQITKASERIWLQQLQSARRPENFTNNNGIATT